VTKTTTPLIRICDRIIEKCKRAGIKKYSSKYDNKLYTNYQFVVLLCLKQKEQCGYRAFIEESLVEWPHVVTHVELETIPHYTTLQKFAQRTKQSILELILLQSISRMNVKKLILGQDGTGFKSRKISCHYVARIEYFSRKNEKKRKPGRPKKNRKIRKYLYVQIMVELRTQMPLGILISRHPGGDARKFKPVAQKVMKLGKEIKYVALDKGYDDEKVHEFIRECLMAESIIPARNEEVAIFKTYGKYRKKMKRGYSKKKYHQRSKNETLNFVVKHKWGDSTLALSWRNQNKEIIFRLILYAARRFTSLVFFLIFYENNYSSSETRNL
jgi:transposase